MMMICTYVLTPIYIYTHTHIHIRIHIHIRMIITHTPSRPRQCRRLGLPQDGLPRARRARRAPRGVASWGPRPLESKIRKGTNGVSTNVVTANCISFERGTFWVLQLAYFYLPKSARAYLFLQSVEIHYFCSGPISVDPICRQPKDPNRAKPCPQACGDLGARSGRARGSLASKGS